jgi:hypothetical protein
MEPNGQNFCKKFKVVVRCKNRPIVVERNSADQRIYNGYGDSLGLALITRLSGRLIILNGNVQILKGAKKGTKALELGVRSNATKNLLTNRSYKADTAFGNQFSKFVDDDPFCWAEVFGPAAQAERPHRGIDNGIQRRFMRRARL